MDVVIAGGGVAGLALAGLLRPQGHRVTVVDPGHDAADGYAIALWPHGTRVLHALGVHDRLVERSLEMSRYTARSGSGALLATATLPPEIARHGHLGVVPRRDLVELLAIAGHDVERRSARVVDVRQHPHVVEAQLDDGTSMRADVLVGADGIGSAVRTATFGRQTGVDTGWTCATWWVDRTEETRTGRLAEGSSGETEEHWGVGSFVGVYPCRERVCLIVGGPSPRVSGPDAGAWLRRTLSEAGLPADRLLPVDDGQVWRWPMADVRSTGWVHHRTALVGDAAAAFLPTAGIGASMALESAAALADELSRTDASHASTALELYERRRRSRVERAQRQSRLLARVLFTTSPAIARLRDGLVARTSVDRLLQPLVRDLEHPV